MTRRRRRSALASFRLERRQELRRAYVVATAKRTVVVSECDECYENVEEETTLRQAALLREERASQPERLCDACARPSRSKRPTVVM